MPAGPTESERPRVVLLGEGSARGRSRFETATHADQRIQVRPTEGRRVCGSGATWSAGEGSGRGRTLLSSRQKTAAETMLFEPPRDSLDDDVDGGTNSSLMICHGFSALIRALPKN